MLVVRFESWPRPAEKGRSDMIAKTTYNLGTADGDVDAILDADDMETLLKQADFLVRASVGATCIEVSRAMAERGYGEHSPRELHADFVQQYGSAEVLLALELEDGSTVPHTVGISLDLIDECMQPDNRCPGNTPKLNGNEVMFLYPQEDESS